MSISIVVSLHSPAVLAEVSLAARLISLRPSPSQRQSTKHSEERRRAEALRLMVLGLENRAYWLALFAFTRPWLKRLSAPFLPMSSAVFLSSVLS